MAGNAAPYGEEQLTLDDHPDPLILAAKSLKARWSVGVSMEEAVVITEDMSTADRMAIALWFGADI